MEYRRIGVYSRDQLTRLLHPQSIAVVGASTRAGAFGKQVLANILYPSGRLRNHLAMF